jgi:hypothetical protein
MHPALRWILAAFALNIGAVTASAQWRVTVPPALDIAATDGVGNVLLQLPIGGTRLSDGTLAVADGMAGRVVFFAPDGKLLRTVGRTGRGPGEFIAISWVGQCARDSVFAWDFPQQRVSVISTAGEITRQSRVPADPTKAGPPFSLACSRSGVVGHLGWPGPSKATSGSFTRGTAPLTIVGVAGDVIGRLGDVWGAEFTSQCGGSFPRPLGKTTYIAVSRDFVFVATGDSASIEVTPIEGLREGRSAIRSIKLPIAARAATRRQLEAASEPFLAWFPAGPGRDKMRSCMQSVPAPDRAPPYSAIHSDTAGTLWIQTSFAGDSTTRLLAMSPAGQRLGELDLPRALTIFEIGTDFVLGRYDAPSGEQHIVLYRYRRGR